MSAEKRAAESSRRRASSNVAVSEAIKETKEMRRVAVDEGDLCVLCQVLSLFLCSVPGFEPHALCHTLRRLWTVAPLCINSPPARKCSRVS